MNIRDKIASDIAFAREALHDAGVADREPRHRSNPYGADAEPDPQPVTDADVDAVVDTFLEDAASYRAYVQKHGAAWPETVRQRWLVRAEELEWLFEQVTGRKAA